MKIKKKDKVQDETKEKKKTKWEKCEDILDEAQKKGNQSKEMFFGLLKTYTAECLYRQVNDIITRG